MRYTEILSGSVKSNQTLLQTFQTLTPSATKPSFIKYVLALVHAHASARRFHKRTCDSWACVEHSYSKEFAVSAVLTTKLLQNEKRHWGFGTNGSRTVQSLRGAVPPPYGCLCPYPPVWFAQNTVFERHTTTRPSSQPKRNFWGGKKKFLGAKKIFWGQNNLLRQEMHKILLKTTFN